jgi:hypothetical protein
MDAHLEYPGILAPPEARRDAPVSCSADLWNAIGPWQAKSIMNRRRTGNRIERGSASGARFAAAATPSGGEAVREPWRRKREGIVVACRLTPKGGRDAIEGFGALADGSRALLARVRAAP